MASKPEKPEDSDCCGSGCSPCVFEVYERQLKLWENQKLPETDPVLNALKYTPFQLIAIENVCERVYLYTFQAVDDSLVPITNRIVLNMGDYLIVKSNFLNGKSKEKISRPYTPVINPCFQNNGRFQTIIKLYPGGKMSDIFRKSITGNLFYWRGPYNHFSYKKTDYLMLFGAGTGIVPLFNIAQELILDEHCETIVKMYGCFQNLESILLRKELHGLTDYWNFSLNYYLSEISNESVLLRENVAYSKLTSELYKGIVASFKDKSVLFVICGPDAFNTFCKDALSQFRENQIVVL